MIKRIQIENFFSFGKPKETIRLLYEGIVGDGFEKVFQQDWGGIAAVANFSREKASYIKIVYEFEKDLIHAATENKGYHFKTNPIYEITINKLGGSGYYLSEWVYRNSDNSSEKPFTFLKMENGIFQNTGISFKATFRS